MFNFFSPYKIDGGGRLYKVKNGIVNAIIPNGAKSIDSYAFSDCADTLESVSIPEGVTCISQRAFSGCTKLKSITFPESLGGIWDYAFEGTGITEITLNSNLEVIGKRAFPGNLSKITMNNALRKLGDEALACTKISSIELNEGLEEIGKGVFAGCKQLESITLPASLKKIHREAFADTSKPFNNNPSNSFNDINKNIYDSQRSLAIPYFSTVIFAEGHTQIQNKLFYKCENLKNAVLPSTMKKIGSEAFSGSGISSINLNEGLEIIKENAFENCKNLENVSLPSTLKNIEKNAFSGTSLSCITLNDGLNEFNFNSLSNCENLKEITIPNSITKIEATDHVNSGNEPLVINYKGDVEDWLSACPIKYCVLFCEKAEPDVTFKHLSSLDDYFSKPCIYLDGGDAYWELIDKELLASEIIKLEDERLNSQINKVLRDYDSNRSALLDPVKKENIINLAMERCEKHSIYRVAINNRIANLERINFNYTED